MRKSILTLLMCITSVVINAETLFPSRTDFRDESIYFVMTTRFFDGDATNNTHCWDGNNPGDPAWRGDFKGLIDKMDYIKALGFTAIWITPIVENASGYDYHGYHAHDFSKVDHRYESDGVGFQQVIDEAHKRGMKIILDIVLNHTGNFGESNLCKMFTRDWTKDQSDIEACMIPYTQKDGGKLPDNYESLPDQYGERLSLMKNTKGKNNDNHNYWHHYGHGGWDDPSRWWMQIAGDCVDLNTEHPFVYNYLIECYSKFIKMGVDGFRIDTGGHIPRLTFNQAFVPAFHAAAESQEAKNKRGNMPFYMFAEVCARYTSIWYREQPNLSPLYYTWAENKTYSWDDNPASWDNIVAMEGDKCETHTNHKSVQQSASDASKPTSQNAFLSGNNYHTPDYSKASGLNVIDFTMHHNFRSIGEAWNIAQKGNDQYYNDATWNVVYVDSHDYAPNSAPEDKRFSGDESTLAENWSLMFTHRGIPCIYYGSEIQFKKGCVIDNGPNTSLINTGRAYFGGYIKGGATVTDFATYTNATGNMAVTLNHPLAKHVQRLNLIRQAVPALRKGQYSMDGCNGSFAFKRRYTDATTDSYALVCISGNATFSGIPNGKYVDCVTGDIKNVTNGTLNATCSGKGNLRVYVLDSQLTPAPGKIGVDGKYLYFSSSTGGSTPTWDGTQEELIDDPTTPDEPEEVIEPCLTSTNQRTVFFTKSDDFEKKINCYIWSSTNTITNGWPGNTATKLGNGRYRFDIPADAPAIDNTWKIIWNDGSNQTNDLTYTNQGMYTGSDKGNISCTSKVTAICEGGTAEPDQPDNPDTPDTPEEPEQSDICLQSADEHVVFFQGTNFGSSANVYMWIKGTKIGLVGAWPGAAATHLGDGKFKFVIPTNVTSDPSNWMIIWNGNGTQTADFAFSMHGLYNFGGLQSIVTTLCEGGEVEPEQPENPDTPDTPEEPITGITVKAKMPAHWTNSITAWIWEDGMDGQAVTPTKDGDWYVVTQNTKSLNIIFRNGTDWNGNTNQTVDITSITNNTCYQISQSGNSKATYEIVACNDNTTTDHVEEQESTLTPIKIIINNALYLIMSNGDMYDTAGRLIRF